MNTPSTPPSGAPHQIPSAGFSITLLLQLDNVPGSFSKVTECIGHEGASLAEVTLVRSDFKHTVREVTVNCASESHAAHVLRSLSSIATATILHSHDDTFELHRGGKLSVQSKSLITTRDQLSRAYTPGVARVCMAIHKQPEEAFTYTIKGCTVAVVTDGSAVLGLGNIGPEAALPVMEGKAMLFKQFARLDAFPICLNTQDTEEIIKAVKLIAPSFGGINLEDISAPRCFEIEERLRRELEIPVFHDDQHGTAVVVLAGVINAAKIIGKKVSDLRVVVNGFGASGVACTKILLSAGIKNIIPCDTAGAVYRGRTENMNAVKQQVVSLTNPENFKGTVNEALKGADMFLGVSSPGAITRAAVASMARDPIIFALANPTPEILPDEIRDIARVIATGRSDYANQVNNALCFPGIFRGALDCRAKDISEGMKLAAALAIAESVPTEELCEEKIIPGIFDDGVAERVAAAVREAAQREGLARV